MIFLALYTSISCGTRVKCWSTSKHTKRRSRSSYQRQFASNDPTMENIIVVTNLLDFTLRRIVHQTSVLCSPQQNGLAERMNRTLVEKASSMLHYNAVEPTWSAEAINCSADLINQLPSSAYRNVLYDRWTGKLPDSSHLRVFGSKGFAQKSKESRSKLDYERSGRLVISRLI